MAAFKTVASHTAMLLFSAHAMLSFFGRAVVGACVIISVSGRAVVIIWDPSYYPVHRRIFIFKAEVLIVQYIYWNANLQSRSGYYSMHLLEH